MAINNDLLKVLQGQVDEWETEIKKLKAQAEKEAGYPEIQQRYYELIEVLRSQQKNVLEQLAQIKSSQEGDWEELKQDIGSSWKKVKTTLSDTGKAFKKGLEEKKQEKK